MAGASSALCQAGQHPAVTKKGPYVAYNPGSVGERRVLAYLHRRTHGPAVEEDERGF